MSDIKQQNFSSREKIATVSFQSKFNTSYGSSLFVVGNLKLLGQWKPNNAIPLTTSTDIYPLWVLKNAFSCPVGTEITYKYFIKDSNGQITWENLPNNMNRKKIISKPGEFLIEDEEKIVKQGMGQTENYDKFIEDKDISSKSFKKKKMKKKNGNKKPSPKEEIKGKRDKKSAKVSKSLASPNSQEFEIQNKMSVPINDQNESEVNDDSIIDGENLKNIAELKMGLDKNFETNDTLAYNINLINKMNSGLFESFLFSCNQNIGEGDRLVFVEEFLPITLKKNEECTEEEEDNKYIIIPNSRYISIDNFVKKFKCRACWVGMLKNLEEFDDIEKEEIYAFLETKMIYVVEVPKKQYEEYNIYYNNILMPTFIDNSISSNNDYNQNYNKYYNTFQLVNKKFAKSLCVFADMNDLILINDMNLCFIPNALAQNRKINWRIGIYIHLCFPSSDVFKAFPNSIDIMYSLILCDVIGFHVYQHARNFITVLERMFWIFPSIKNKGYMTFEYLGKYSFIFIKYCGFDNERIMKIMNEKEDKSNEMIEEKKNYVNYLVKYKKIIKDKLSIISVDNAIEMTELILKFNSYKIYLQKNKEQQGKTILIEILCYKNTYKMNLERIHQEVQKIKDEFGEDSIYYEEFNEDEKNISTEELIGIFTLANIFFSLQIWNKICCLVSLYLYVQNQNHSQDKIFGVIINESNAISPKIKSINRINPYNIEQIFSSIDKIIEQENKIRMILYNKDLKYIQEHNSDNFFQSYFGDLKLITSNKKDLNSIEFGLKNDIRVMKLRKDFAPLTINILQSKYNSSKCRLFFLDYEETLQSFLEKDSDNAKNDDYEYILEKHAPSEKLLNILKNLSDNPKNYVYIITGKPTKLLKEWFKGVDNLGFGSEYGFFWKDAHDPEGDITTTLKLDNKWKEWKDSAYTIIKQFESKTEGSRTEIKDSSICWNFGNSDQYSGNIQASDLTIQLSNLFANQTDLEVVTGRDYVEIKPKNINKGYFISYILKSFVNLGKKPDYIFACGDDVSDEEMFKYLNFVNKQNNKKEEIYKIITSTVLKKPSAAQYFVPAPEELLNLLDSLTSSKYN